MSAIAINWNKCSGKGTCIEVCPTDVFTLREIKEHPETLKAVVVRENNCIFCMKCVSACIEDAITIRKTKSTI
jgi:NAD-dependent dihydropyrimidine dehydrogenase PreA subunit